LNVVRGLALNLQRYTDAHFRLAAKKSSQSYFWQMQGDI
jgi:hypothetical protein